MMRGPSARASWTARRASRAGTASSGSSAAASWASRPSSRTRRCGRRPPPRAAGRPPLTPGRRRRCLRPWRSPQAPPGLLAPAASATRPVAMEAAVSSPSASAAWAAARAAALCPKSTQSWARPRGAPLGPLPEALKCSGRTRRVLCLGMRRPAARGCRPWRRGSPALRGRWTAPPRRAHACASQRRWQSRPRAAAPADGAGAHRGPGGERSPARAKLAALPLRARSTRGQHGG
mmetsp:Transcript_37953/g.120646  ORF Transcript_37953/g.120646 Transcript_37953/m.120646 type:complete len:234 (-) Transcript_37953:75-776(-)